MDEGFLHYDIYIAHLYLRMVLLALNVSLDRVSELDVKLHLERVVGKNVT